MLHRSPYARSRYKQTPVDEFELIRRYFDRQRATPGVITGIGDDGAILSVPGTGLELVQVVDTLVEDVHFPAATSAADIAYRAVAVNLSDIAAMGARPRWMTLALTMPSGDEHWLVEFAKGLFKAADAHEVALVGGDTTRGASIVVTVNMTGEVAAGRALLRSGASAGDTIFVTGTIGDAAAGLALLQSGGNDDFLCGRFLRPSARVDTGARLVGRASAAIDLSDGLLGDLRKLLDASGVGGEIDVASVPLSNAMKSRFEQEERTRFALFGGDDYELCFTAADERISDLDDASPIGRVTGESGLVCRLDGDIVDYDDSGYRHFR